MQRNPAGDPRGEVEPDASLEAFLASCLLAFFGEVKNAQHGLADDPDRMEEREASPVTKAYVLSTFCVG